jgi:hypothetical protein
MTTAQEQYTEIVKQGQDAVLAAVDTWTRTVQDAFGQLPTTPPVKPEQIVDQVFDFAGKVLGAQRDFAKHLIATSTAAAENIRTGAAQATEAADQG